MGFKKNNLIFLSSLFAVLIASGCTNKKNSQEADHTHNHGHDHSHAIEEETALDIETEEVTYQLDGKTFTGYLAKPKSIAEKLPGVLVVHEWWGQTEYPRMRAEMLAKLGYVALAVDMYGDQKIAEHPQDASKFSSLVMKDSETVGGRLKKALETLKSQKSVNKSKTAAIGYCFGGSVVIEAAKQKLDLEAVVSFHGGLKTPTEASPGIETKLLVINGAQDPFVKPEDIQNFKSEMTEAKADFQFVNIKDSVHAFTNPEATEKGKKYDLPLAYNKEADEKSWQMMKEFFQKTLK